MMRKPSSAAVVAVALVLGALTSCAGDSDPADSARPAPTEADPGQDQDQDQDQDADPGTDPDPDAETDAETEADASPPAPPTGPCAEGSCEVEVAVGDVLEVPESYGLGPIEVIAIGGGEVEMAAPLTGSGYSVAGCSGGGGVSSAGGGGVGLSCAEGVVATINDAMSLEVVETSDAAAVLRIEPAN
ncbi:hypothetical protein RM844_06105 [Streptomyces sp. DSM 44915]|uniref:Lipoprotein n=1 Tax=Streptomyces chisholmiae TaxID=3075540 RepID=A0ABU2JLJ9_9ACTN|nr:hypothetical protein [Streptomyces sp. DSM 44915]MDT0265861.1 hypothetical protein [Streptomyces sp. DSM 44915]